MSYIWGKRHFAHPVEHLLEHSLINILYQSSPRIGSIAYNRMKLGRNLILKSFFCLASRLYKRFPHIVAHPSQQQKLELSVSVLPVSVESRGDYLGIVPYKHIAGIYVIEYIRKMPVTHGLVAPVINQKSRLRAHLHRCLCNQLLRQIIVKVTGFQKVCSFASISLHFH